MVSLFVKIGFELDLRMEVLKNWFFASFLLLIDLIVLRDMMSRTDSSCYCKCFLMSLLSHCISKFVNLIVRLNSKT